MRIARSSKKVTESLIEVKRIAEYALTMASEKKTLECAKSWLDSHLSVRALVLDLAKFSGTKTSWGDVIDECIANRAPPIAPAAFRATLEGKAFTSKKADMAMVGGLYEGTFGEQMAAAKTLRFVGLQWGDAEVAALCATLIESGEKVQATDLDLRFNPFGEAGCAALAKAVSTGAMPKLEELSLNDNPIADAGCAKLASALDGGVMPVINRLYLFGIAANNQSAVQEALARAKARRG